jgi:hypothetical protein
MNHHLPDPAQTKKLKERWRHVTIGVIRRLACAAFPGMDLRGFSKGQLIELYRVRSSDVDKAEQFDKFARAMDEAEKFQHTASNELSVMLRHLTFKLKQRKK